MVEIEVRKQSECFLEIGLELFWLPRSNRVEEIMGGI